MGLLRGILGVSSALLEFGKLAVFLWRDAQLRQEGRRLAELENLRMVMKHAQRRKEIIASISALEPDAVYDAMLNHGKRTDNGGGVS